MKVRIVIEVEAETEDENDIDSIAEYYRLRLYPDKVINWHVHKEDKND